MPTYHHLDISATLTPKNKDRRRMESVYNLYNRKNAASINFRQNADSGNNE
jgi:hypothetical protein